MRLRMLGRTGLEVSEIGFGCGTTADLMINGDANARRNAVAAAFDAGINYFDTATVYGNGASEANLGQALRELGVRPVLATKVALEAADFESVFDSVVRSVEASVQRLGMPITLIQLHNRVGAQRAAKAPFGSGALLTVDDVLGEKGVIQAFESLRARGLVRFFGCSAYGGETGPVRQLIDSGKFDALIASFSMLNPTAWSDPPPRMPMPDYARSGERAAAAGMGTIALRVLEAGVLTNDPPWAQTAALKPDQAAMLAQARVLRDTVGQEDAAFAHTAIRFALSNDDVSVVLIGFSALSQIGEAALCSMRGPLPAATLQRIALAHAHGFA